MKRLAPDLFARRFGELMEMGRARLPGLAPEWTDHNAHDPGVTFMELLAWVTEAQLYSLGRMRRDERAAYAALFGLAPTGARPARGLLWPDRLDSGSPLATYARSVVIPANTVVNLQESETPGFRLERNLLWIAGRVKKLTARLGGRRVVDYTIINQRGGPAFQPFGATAGANDVLAMEFECRGDDGIFPPQRADAEGALWPIGVRADTPLAGGSPDSASMFPLGTACQSELAAALVVDGERIPLKVVSDTTAGLLRTGTLLLDLSAVPGSPRSFTVELHNPRGFERPPRLLRIEPNVVPIVQGYRLPDELHVAMGLPDWSFQLNVPGLRFGPLEPSLVVEQRDSLTNRRTPWRAGTLAEAGPDDPVFELDATGQEITFGNGVNGRIPPTDAQMVVTYSVCDGERGSVAANRRWRVGGFPGSFGVNVDVVAGGTDPTTWIDERREARRRARDDHALVSAADIEASALELPLLEVVRAWVLAPADRAPQTGAITLIAMRARRSEEEADDAPETPRWLDAVRRRLIARVPLATRLEVQAPRYIGFSIRAQVEAATGLDLAVVKEGIECELRKRLALAGDDARRPGVPVTKRDLTAWIRAVTGVRRADGLRLTLDTGREVDEIAVPRNGLPRFSPGASAITVVRGTQRGAS